MDAAQLERDELAWFNAYQVRRDEFRTLRAKPWLTLLQGIQPRWV